MLEGGLLDAPGPGTGDLSGRVLPELRLLYYRRSMSRLPCLVLLGFSLGLLACDGSEPDAPPVETTEVVESEGAPSRPNIVLIVVDDMGFTDLGAFGSEIETPRIDALARRGLRLTDFHTSVACSPTRSMLLSGIDNHEAGLGNMAEMLTDAQRGRPGYEGHLRANVVSLAEALRAGGYTTFMSGKWHLGYAPGQRPHDRGFDHSFAFMYGGGSHFDDMAGLYMGHDPVVYTQNGEALDALPANFYSSQSYTDYLMQSIREERVEDAPFLAYLAFTAVHDPIQVPEPWLGKYRGHYDEGYEALRAGRVAGAIEAGLVGEGVRVGEMHERTRAWASLSAEERAYQSRMMEVYAGMVDNVDYNVGRFLDFLKDIGEYDDTVFVLLSDNGPNAWSSEVYPGNDDGTYLSRFDQSLQSIGTRRSSLAYGIGWAQASAGPYSLFKMTAGEGGIRSPLIVAGPGISGGRSSGAFSTVMDIMPTLLELANVERPGTFEGRTPLPMRGRSMAPLLRGDAEIVHPDDSFSAGEMVGGMYVRQGEYKAVSVAPPYGDGAWALYDLEQDPGETHDLSTEEPERLAAMRRAYATYAVDVGVVAP